MFIKMNQIIHASPKVRKFARQLGADISQLKGSERNGRITEDDVRNFIKNQIKQQENTPKKSIKDEKKKLEFDHSEFGEIEITQMPRIKRLAAPNLSESWRTIPHVTHHDEADVTELESFRKNLKDNFTGEKKKITPLAFIIKALVNSLKKFPHFNCSIKDEENYELILKKYFHIGIAVDTEHGLMVPKIRNADSKKIEDLSIELKDISEKCRNLKIDIISTSTQIFKGVIQKINISAEDINYKDLFFDKLQIEADNLKINFKLTTKELKFTNDPLIKFKISLTQSSLRTILLSKNWHWIGDKISKEILNEEKLIDIKIRNGQLLIKTSKDDINIIKEQHINVTAEKGKVYLNNEAYNKIIEIPIEDKIYIKKICK